VELVGLCVFEFVFITMSYIRLKMSVNIAFFAISVLSTYIRIETCSVIKKTVAETVEYTYQY
jgi:hypothetical protein